MKSVIHIFIFILASTSLSSFASEGDGERSGASPHDRGFVDSARESEEEREETQAREAIADLQPEDEEEREEVFNKKYNAAVDEMERLAAQFNAEVQAYRAQESN